MVTVEELKQAYGAVSLATENMQSAGVNFERAKERLDIDILKATANGQVVGSNDGARKAAALVLFEDAFKDRDEKESLFKELSNTLTLAQIHLNFVRDCIRIEELAKAK